MLKKLFKALLCASLLVTGFIMNPTKTKAALGEPEIETQAAGTLVYLTDRLVWFKITHSTYGTSYYPVWFDGNYTYNKSGTNYFVNGINLSKEQRTEFTYKSKSISSSNIASLQVDQFLITSYTAPSSVGITINFKAYVSLNTGGSAGFVTGFTTVY